MPEKEKTESVNQPTSLEKSKGDIKKLSEDIAAENAEKEKNDRRIFGEVLRVLWFTKNEKEIREFWNYFEAFIWIDFSEIRKTMLSVPEKNLYPSNRKKTLEDLQQLENKFKKIRWGYRWLRGSALDVLDDNKTTSIERNKENWGDLIRSSMEIAAEIERIGHDMYHLSNRPPIWYLGASQVVQVYGQMFVEGNIGKLIPELERRTSSEMWESVRGRFDTEWPIIEKECIWKSMSLEETSRAKIRFQAWLTTTELWTDVLKRMASYPAEKIPSLMVMAFYVHGAPDQNKAILEYMTFNMAIETPQKILGWLARGAMALEKKLPKLAKFAEKCLTKAHSWPALFASIVIITIACFIPWVAETIEHTAEWLGNQIDDDNIILQAWRLINDVFDAPFTGAELLLQNIGLLTIDPRREQMDVMKQWVENKNISELVQGDLIEHYNNIIAKKWTNPIAKKFWDHYLIQDVNAWWERQIPDFYSKSVRLQQEQEALEDSLHNLTDPNTGRSILDCDEHLSYFQTATREGNPDSSNRKNVNMLKTLPGIERKLRSFFVPRVNNGGLITWKAFHWQEKAFEEARKAWESLDNAAREVAREVDVYRYLRVYDEKLWNDPDTKYSDARMPAYIHNAIWEQRIGDDLRVIEKNLMSIQEQAREITKLITSHGGEDSWLAKLGKIITLDWTPAEASAKKQQLVFLMDQISESRSTEWINTVVQKYLVRHIVSGKPLTADTLEKIIGEIVENDFQSEEEDPEKIEERRIERIRGQKDILPRERVIEQIIGNPRDVHKRKYTVSEQERGDIILKETNHHTYFHELQKFYCIGYHRINTHQSTDKNTWTVKSWYWNFWKPFVAENAWFNKWETKELPYSDFLKKRPGILEKSWANKVIDEVLQKNKVDAERIEKAKNRSPEFVEICKEGIREDLDDTIIYYTNTWASKYREEWKTRKNIRSWDYIWQFPENSSELLHLRCVYLKTDNTVWIIELTDIKQIETFPSERQKIIRHILCTPRRDDLETMVRLSEGHLVNEGLVGTEWVDYRMKLFTELKPLYDKSPDKRKFLENLLQKMKTIWGITQNNWKEFLPDR